MFDTAVRAIEAVRGVDLQLVQRTGERTALRGLYKLDPAEAQSLGRVFVRKAHGLKPAQGDSFEVGDQVLTVHTVTENIAQYIASVRLARRA